MNISKTTRRLTITASLAAAVAAGTVAPATAEASDNGTSEITSAAQLAATKPVNVVGLPVKVPVPANWAVTSPRQLAKTKPATYPLAIRTQARKEHETPAQWVAENRAMSVFGVLSPRHSFSQGIAIYDLTGRSYPFAALMKDAKKNGTITRTSKVSTRFGTAYRVHYTSTDPSSGLRYQGVVALMKVKGHGALISTVGLTTAGAQYPSDLALKGAAPR